jgi:hypothetical protein
MPSQGFNLALVVVLSCITLLAGLTSALPVAPGKTCKCKLVPNNRRCFYLDQSSVPAEMIPTGQKGIRCTQKVCGPRYECCETGDMHCIVKRVPYTLTCTGYVKKHEVCMLKRPLETYLVPYTDIPRYI